MEIYKEKVTPEVVEEPVEQQHEDAALVKKSESDTIEIWEAENNTKVVNDYFGANIIGETFQVKMPMGEITKFVNQELERQGFEKTRTNFRETLIKIEKEIGSEKLELFSRLHKLTGYIRAVNKLYKAKALKDKYIFTHQSEL